jgi:hypothetical protein
MLLWLNDQKLSDRGVASWLSVAVRATPWQT